MFAVSRDYAPPFGMIVPFFIIGTVLYLVSMIALLGIEPERGYFDPFTAGWAHLYLLGFVMMIIFGAMAQLIPVVVEVGHHSVDLYYVIWPILLIGTLLMVGGFWWYPVILPFGGLLVLTAMIIYLYDTLMTLKKTENITLTVKTAIAANLFLTTGIVVGFIMSLSLGMGVEVDIYRWIGTHVVFVVGGYVVLTIMGLSLILLPMFGLAHGFEQKSAQIAYNIMLAGVILYFLSTLIDIDAGRYAAIIAIFVSIAFYMHQIWLIYKVRARKEDEIWARSMFFGYASLVISLVAGVAAVVFGSDTLIISSMWFLMMGFIGFLITGHLYKIIPFLVWFERYSPLVGKEKVPMLHEMYPKKMADWEFYFASLGVVAAGLGIVSDSGDLFRGGVVLMIVGAIFMLLSVKWMLSFSKGLKKED